MNGPDQSWLDIKRRYPVGATVTGSVIDKREYGLFLGFDDGAKGLLLITRFKQPSTSIDLEDCGPLTGDQVSATVYLQNDDTQHLVLTQLPLDQTI